MSTKHGTQSADVQITSPIATDFLRSQIAHARMAKTTNKYLLSLHYTRENAR